MTLTRLDYRATPASPWHLHRWATTEQLRRGAWMNGRTGELHRGTVTVRTRLCGCGAWRRWEIWPAGKRRVR